MNRFSWLFRTRRRSAEDTDREMLRAEYEQCAEDARAVGARGWQVVYIFLSAIILGLALIAGQLVDHPRKEHDWSTVGLVVVVGVVGSVLAAALIGINRRQRWLHQITYERMRQLERSLDMRKHTYIDILDHWADRCDNKRWQEFSEEERQLLREIEQRHRRLRPPLLGGHIVAVVASLTIFGWVGFVVWELAIVLDWGG